MSATAILVMRKTSPVVAKIGPLINNGLKNDVSTHFHVGASERTIGYGTLSGVDAAATAAAIAAANAAMKVYLFHVADLVSHKGAGTLPELVKATDLATAETLANDIKADYNLHIADETTAHFNDDTANAIAASDATDLASLQTLLNQMKTKINAHMADGPDGRAVRVVAG